MNVKLLVVLLLVGTSLPAQNTGAKTNGNWEATSTWTTGTIPGSSNNVYIGSSVPPAPTGTAATATVTLTANESANNVFLGAGTGGTGTLNLGGNKLTVGTALNIGTTVATGVLNEGGGSFTSGSVDVERSSLTFGSADVTGSLIVGQGDLGGTATTVATGN